MIGLEENCYVTHGFNEKESVAFTKDRFMELLYFWHCNFGILATRHPKLCGNPVIGKDSKLDGNHTCQPEQPATNVEMVHSDSFSNGGQGAITNKIAPLSSIIRVTDSQFARCDI